MSQVLLFPDADRERAGNRLLDYDRQLRGNPLLEDDIRAHVRENSLSAQIGEVARQGRAVRENIGPWARTLPGRVGGFIERTAGLPGDVYAGRVDPRSDEAIERSLDLAGMMALSATAAPRGALGSGAVRRAARPGLPMDEASRMARAREMGFGDTEYYHGTRSDFGEFGRIDGGNAYGNGYYFTKDPAEGSQYATGEGVNRITVEGDAGPNVMPVKLNIQKPFPTRGVISKEDIAAIEKAVNDIAPDGPIFKPGELAKTFDRDYPANGDNVMYQIPSWAQSHAIRAAGFDGMDTPMGTVAFKPSQIRSRFAAFDPANRGSSDILASMAPIGIGTVGALPLIAGERRE
jgi:hypothetical protein